jgi:Zn-dependent M28 family amino/carboxypeptidase
MNQQLKELYIEFHTKRRIQIEKDVEIKFNSLVADEVGGFGSSHFVLDSLAKQAHAHVMAMRQSEQDEFIEYGNLIISKYITRSYNDDIVYTTDLIEENCDGG